MKAKVWFDKDCGINLVCLSLFLWVMGFAVQVTAQSHTETYATYRIVDKQMCRQNSRKLCSGWWTGRDCKTEYSCDYYTVTAVESVTATRCQSGWSRYPDCNDIDECQEGTSGCEKYCSNTPGSFRCSCDAGYALASNGRSCSDINECNERTSECTQSCFNAVGSYTCDCNSGYQLAADGHACNDIDECQLSKPVCAVTCFNTVGSYSCSCLGGYTLSADGQSCQDIDECTGGRSECAHNCSNTIGSYTCGCYSGYRLAENGRSCNDIDECTAQLEYCTVPDSFTCENTNGDYRCICRTGFEQVGPHECRDINECETLSDNCTLYENMTCENIIGSYKCRRPGFEGQSGGGLMSESTIRLIIIVTVCVVSGVALIVTAVVCLVICAKKRKMNEDRKTSTAENVCANVTVTFNSTSSGSDNQESHYDNLTETTTSTSGASERTKDLKTGKTKNKTIYQELVAATKQKNNIYEAIRKPSNSINMSVPLEAIDSSNT